MERFGSGVIFLFLQVFETARNNLGTTVDQNILDKAVNFIKSKYSSDGTFREDGRVIHTNMMGGATGKTNLAAYIYATFAELSMENVVNFGQVRNYLVQSASQSEDPYQLSLIAYALSFHADDAQFCDAILTRLLQLATNSDDMIYWKIEENGHAVETAGYALLTVLARNDLDRGIKIAKWLMTQRNSLGGFHSTQDTVIGLKALSAISAKFHGAKQAMRVAVKAKYLEGKAERYRFSVDGDNSLLLQTEDLPPNRQDLYYVRFRMFGTGVALFQLSIRYNLRLYDSGDIAIRSQEVARDFKNTFMIETCVKFV